MKEYKITNLTFSYGKNTILNNISASIPAGQCYALVGANGSGKSTLISVLAGSKKAAAGQLDLPNTPTVSLKQLKRPATIGYVPQENPLLEGLSGYDNLLLWFEGNRSDFKKALESPLIEMLGITKYLDKKVSKLSGGMKRRLSLAIGLINNPEFLLLDEPSAALDLPGKAAISEYLNEYIKNGGTILLTSHEEAELQLCNGYLILKNGCITDINNPISIEEILKMI